MSEFNLRGWKIGAKEMAPQVGLEPAEKQQTKNLAEYSWRIAAL